MSKGDLILIAIVLGIVLLVVYPSFNYSPPEVYNCADHNNDYVGCVNAQNSGKSCAWYAGCNVCSKLGTSLQKACNP